MKMNVMLVGPCGVGKTTVSMRVAVLAKLKYHDFDAIGIAHMKKVNPLISPYSKSRLNLKKSLHLILGQAATRFILAMGGDTVFNKCANNDERLEQVLCAKKTYALQIVVLTARKDILEKRFVASRNEFTLELSDFGRDWEEWLDIAEPYWRKCSDIVIDTSDLAPDEVRIRIEAIL